MAVLVIKCDGQAYLQRRDLGLRGHVALVIACPIDEQRMSADLLLMIEFRSKHDEGGKTDRLCSTDFIYI